MKPYLKTCTKCGVSADEECFAKDNPRSRRNVYITTIRRRALCIACEQEQRDARKAPDPFLAKARSTITHHARKLHFSVAELRDKYGWDVRWVAHLLAHAYENSCEYCRKSYKSMRHGLADLTLDIVDPKKLPYIRTNVRVCCQTCNREKSKMPPEAFERRLYFWQYRAEFLERKKGTPLLGLPLFENVPTFYVGREDEAEPVIDTSTPWVQLRLLDDEVTG